MLIADFGFGDYDTDAVRPFLLMFLVGVASVGDRSTVLVVPNVFFGYFCVCSLSSSNAVANEFDRAITSCSIWGMPLGDGGLSPYNKFHYDITSHRFCQFFSSHQHINQHLGRSHRQGWAFIPYQFASSYHITSSLSNLL